MRQSSIIALLLILSAWGHVSGQSIPWTQWEHLEDSLKKQPKPVYLFIHTDWCRYCRMQEKVSFKDPQVLAIISDQYYALQLNAEDTATIQFKNSTYYFDSSQGYHQLALTFKQVQQTLTFPTHVFLTAELDQPNQLPGYFRKNELLAALVGWANRQ